VLSASFITIYNGHYVTRGNAQTPACMLHVLLFASADTQIRHEHINAAAGSWLNNR